MKKHKVETPKELCSKLNIEYNPSIEAAMRELTKQLTRQIYDISLLSPSDKTQVSLKIINYMKGTPYEQQRLH